jgi:hypothetical protein
MIIKFICIVKFKIIKFFGNMYTDIRGCNHYFSVITSSVLRLSALPSSESFEVSGLENP